MIEPGQSTRSAITVAGISGCSASMLPHPGLERRERRRHQRALIPWRSIRDQRPVDRRPPNPQLPRNSPPRNTVRDKPPDRPLGRAEVGGHSVALLVPDARQHIHLLGSTGSGMPT